MELQGVIVLVDKEHLKKKTSDMEYCSDCHKFTSVILVLSD